MTTISIHIPPGERQVPGGRILVLTTAGRRPAARPLHAPIRQHAHSAERKLADTTRPGRRRTHPAPARASAAMNAADQWVRRTRWVSEYLECWS